MALDARLVHMLVCPACRAAVESNADSTSLRCTGCGRRYPVRDGIPVMLLDEAEEPPPPDPGR